VLRRREGGGPRPAGEGVLEEGTGERGDRGAEEEDTRRGEERIGDASEEGVRIGGRRERARAGTRCSPVAGAAIVVGLAACATANGDRTSAVPVAPRGVRLADLTWVEAEKVLTPETVVVIPIGAASKEHGPHLLLSNDYILAEYFARRVLETEDV